MWTTRSLGSREPTCFNCQKKGHFANKCPSNPNLFCDERSFFDVLQPQRKDHPTRPRGRKTRFKSDFGHWSYQSGPTSCHPLLAHGDAVTPQGQKNSWCEPLSRYQSYLAEISLVSLMTKMKRMPTTRAQEKRQQEAEQKLQEKEKESGAVAKPLEEQMVQTEPQREPFDSLDESLFIPRKGQRKKDQKSKTTEKAGTRSSSRHSFSRNYCS